ncbi:hypothetical protein LUZ60_017439 [Juncus effusus]|nr:hypothetical protein LUZ60_017439 [Juncus effusus]
MSCAATSKASMVVTASMAAVEALKDQVGLCRWNHAMRSLYQRVSNRTGSLSSQARKTTAASNSISSSSDSSINGGEILRKKRSEEKLEKAYHLICWGPN